VSEHLPTPKMYLNVRMGSHFPPPSGSVPSHQSLFVFRI
jgi:hypothetical protein